jgi:hypothetical protein
MIDNAKLVISLSLTEITNGDLKASSEKTIPAFKIKWLNLSVY